MKKVLLILLTAAGTLQSIAQEDTTIVNIEKSESGDTIRVGSMIIVKKGSHGNGSYKMYDDGDRHRNYYRKNITTNWLVFDIGYAGYEDKTDYSSDEAQDFLHDQGGEPAIKGDYSIKGTRISNYNLWIMMQRLNLVKHIVNLKYGIGFEWNTGQDDPLIHVNDTGIFVLTIFMEMSPCPRTLYWTITDDTCYTQPELYLYVPNVFTPNEDLYNQYFEITNIGLYRNSRLIVYDRWGMTVFEANGYKNDWDGNAVTSGVYYYILSLNRNDQRPLKGSLSIIK